MRPLSLVSVALTFAALSACDYSGDWLFSGVTEVPAIVHLGEITPVDLSGLSMDEARKAAALNTIYAEVGSTGTVEDGGVTFNVIGNGGSICVWVDPELATWNQAVKAQNPIKKWSYPDNIFDDGDLDLYAGLSVYYQGAPGEKVGDFNVRWEDPLGNVVPISLSECNNRGYANIPNAHAGRGQPEYCTLISTERGLSYTVLMQTWSTPLDDDRLGYGLLVAEGPCPKLKESLGVGSVAQEECLIAGESINPDYGAAGAQGPNAKAAGLPEPSWIGSCTNYCQVALPLPVAPDPELGESDVVRYNEELSQWETDCATSCAEAGIDQVPTWGGSIAFEDAFCNTPVVDFCELEAAANLADGTECGWNEADGDRCYCGDPTDTPKGGAF